MTTLIYTGRLIVTNCWCGISQAIPEDLYREARFNGHTVYCPLGHPWVMHKGKSLEQQLADVGAESDRRRQLLEDERVQHQRTERSRNAYKGELTKVRKTIHAGRCPWCLRPFKRLAAHMAAKHPDVDPEAEPT
jgi:hypothetical protein